METAGLPLPEEFESWDRTEQIKYIGETWLEAEGATSSDDEGTKTMFPDLDIPESSVFQYLSALVRNAGAVTNAPEVPEQNTKKEQRAYQWQRRRHR
jgi:hypothetical protein